MSTKATTLTSQIRIGRCSSCGEILQELNPNAVGYISHARRVKHLDNGLCDRCYSLRHSENSRAPEFGEDYIKILEKIKESGSLAVFVCSIPDLDSSCIQNIGEYLPSNLIVVLNKKDVVGMELDDKQIASSALKRLKAEKIFPSKAIVTSPMKDYHIRELLDLINSMRQGKDVYVLGAYSVGKSSLINAILRKYVNNTSRVISTSQVEGTSLQVMEIPLDDESSLYDTPGIFNSKSMLSYVNRMDWNAIVIKEKKNPRILPSASGQAFLLGGLSVVEVKEGGKSNFEFEMGDDVTLTRIKSNQIERTFNSLIQSRSAYPTSTDIASLDNLERKELVCPKEGKMELTIYGLVKIRFAAAGQKIIVYVPNKVGVRVIAIDE